MRDELNKIIFEYDLGTCFCLGFIGWQGLGWYMFSFGDVLMYTVAHKKRM
jgi:hypothetical protein